MRARSDPRFTVARSGQVEFRDGPRRIDPELSLWRLTPSPLGGWLTDGVVLHDRMRFKPYRYRDPSRQWLWRSLPADLIALMAEEGVDALT